jgi:hypothetical protein
LVLTGDSHHYSRFIEPDVTGRDVHYITAGGGGAFLHPTHQLHSNPFDCELPPPGTPLSHRGGTFRRNFRIATDSTTAKPSLFPTAEESRRLSWGNLAFAIYNPLYALVVGGAAAFFAWLLQANAQLHGHDLTTALGGPGSSYVAALCAYLGLVFATPWPFLSAAAIFGGYYYLADFVPTSRRLLAGGLHAFVQIGAVVAVTPLLAWLVGAGHDGWHTVLLIVSIGVAGGLLGATLLGVYFLFCLSLFGTHWNEAFSSLRIADYKNFVRLHIATTGDLTVYPIGLRKVPKDDDTSGPRNPPLTPHLIETPFTLR